MRVRVEVRVRVRVRVRVAPAMFCVDSVCSSTPVFGLGFGL